MAKKGLDAIVKASGRPFEEVHQEQMDLVPLKKMSEPEEIASFVNYLLSNEQNSFTGQSFDMNCGAAMP